MHLNLVRTRFTLFSLHLYINSYIKLVFNDLIHVEKILKLCR